jgi:hypothetical protein
MLQREFRLLQSNIRELKIPIVEWDPAAREKNNLKNAIVKGELGKVKKILEKTPRMINSVKLSSALTFMYLIDTTFRLGS